VLGVCLVLGGGALSLRLAAAGSSYAPVERSLAANESAAATEAPLLLARVVPPPGATVSASEPVGDGGLLREPGPSVATPALVQSSAWWVAPGRPAEVLAYVAAHLPAGAGRESWGSGLSGPGIPRNQTETFGFGAVPGVITLRQLSLWAVQLPEGKSALRATAAVVWTIPRTPAQTIPPGARVLRISVLGTLRANQPYPTRLTITRAAKIEAIVAMLNDLEASQPFSRACPVDFGIRVRLAFYATGSTPPLAVAVLSPEGCGAVQLTIHGKPEGSLEDAYPLSGPQRGRSLLQELDRVLGRALDTRPRPRG